MEKLRFFIATTLCLFTLVLQGQIDILKNGALFHGFDIGLATSSGIKGFVTIANDSMTIKFPANQAWAVVFITVSKPVMPEVTMSKITLVMKGQVGNEIVELGVKDSDDPDDGSECKLPIKLNTKWETYTIDLRTLQEFCEPGSPLKLSQIYIPIEFEYIGTRAQTIFIRSIQYE